MGGWEKVNNGFSKLFVVPWLADPTHQEPVSVAGNPHGLPSNTQGILSLQVSESSVPAQQAEKCEFLYRGKNVATGHDVLE